MVPLSLSDRYAERLAPGTKFADLIGEIDPAKVLSAGAGLNTEASLSFGLIPRMHRGIFAMNELPDLDDLVQVGLFNILEERDVQIRGHKVRLPLDVILVASANPEDYTNRGRLITPLKDRFGSQIRTHYPLDLETEVAIIEQEADVSVSEGFDLTVPSFMTEVVASVTHAARRSQSISQRSGVSVRLSISNFEIMVANSVRRALRSGAATAVPRIVDLEALPASTSGKVEIETLDEGRDGEILAGLVKAGILQVFKDRVPPDTHRAVVDAFDETLVVDTGEDVTDEAYVALVEKVPALRPPVDALLEGEDNADSPAMIASVPAFAPSGPPLIGASRKPAPCASQAACRSREVARSTVPWSTNIFPSTASSTTPSSPRKNSRPEAISARHTSTRSASRTRSRGASMTTAPSSASAFSRVRL